MRIQISEWDPYVINIDSKLSISPSKRIFATLVARSPALSQFIHLISITLRVAASLLASNYVNICINQYHHYYLTKAICWNILTSPALHTTLIPCNIHPQKARKTQSTR